MKRRFAAAVVLVLIGLAFFFAFAKRSPRHSSTWVALPDGTSVRILAATYGTNHVVGSLLGRLIAHLPGTLRVDLTRILGNRVAGHQTVITSEPVLLVWLDRKTNSSRATTPTSGYFQAFLADNSNFVSGAEDHLSSRLLNSHVEAVHFTVFPRRSPEITLNIFYHDPTGGVSQCCSLSFANPVYRRYPEWKSEWLPATKRVGDVEVTLLSVHTGHNANTSQAALRDGSVEVTYGNDRRDGRNHTAVDLKLRPLTNTNEVWKATCKEISDATGNMARSSSMRSGSDYAGFAFMPSLWPSEQAWKLKLEIKRDQGFRAEELFVFKKTCRWANWTRQMSLRGRRILSVPP